MMCFDVCSVPGGYTKPGILGTGVAFLGPSLACAGTPPDASRETSVLFSTDASGLGVWPSGTRNLFGNSAFRISMGGGRSASWLDAGAGGGLVREAEGWVCAAGFSRRDFSG